MKRIILILFCFPIISIAQTTVKLQKKGGVYLIPCKVNGKSLNFVFDTGASDVSLSIDEAKRLYDEGLLKKSDFLLETEQYQIASGEIVENKIVFLRSIEINGLLLSNVKASISASVKAPLLLGQSALSKFGEFTFNYQTSTLKINSNTSVDIKKRIEEAKKKLANSGIKGNNFFLSYRDRILRQERIKQEINNHLDFDVVKIDTKYEDDGLVLSFKYDVTNESDLDYTFIELGFNDIYIDVITEDGKTYSSKCLLGDVIAKKTVAGDVHGPTKINIRNKKAKYFRIYPMSRSTM